MRLQRKFFLPAVAAVLLGAAPPVRAQFSIGGHASYTKSDGADSTWWGGGQVRFRFGGPFGAEGLVDYRRTTYSVAGINVLKVEQYPVQASLMIYPLPAAQRVQPYLLGGAGWYFTRSTYLGPDALLGSTTEHKFGPHLGGGVGLKLAPGISVYGDVRWVWLNVSSINDIRDRYHNNPEADFLHVTTGLNFGF